MINGGNITGNKAVYAGGGIQNTGNMTINHANISDNSAPEGAGVYVSDPGALEIIEGNITNNTASKSGGGVYVAKKATAIISEGDIEKNSAESYGGGIYSEGATRFIPKIYAIIPRNAAAEFTAIAVQ